MPELRCGECDRLGFLTTEGAIGGFITSEEELGHVLPPLFFYITDVRAVLPGMWVPGGFLIGIARVRQGLFASSVVSAERRRVWVWVSAQIAFMSVACGGELPKTTPPRLDSSRLCPSDGASAAWVSRRPQAERRPALPKRNCC